MWYVYSYFTIYTYSNFLDFSVICLVVSCLVIFNCHIFWDTFVLYGIVCLNFWDIF